LPQEKLDQLAAMLREWSRQDFGDLPEFIAGEWSRRNLDAMIGDIEVAAQYAPTVTR
jgi:hypothetical protein